MNLKIYTREEVYAKTDFDPLWCKHSDVEERITQLNDEIERLNNVINSLYDSTYERQ
jgi:hypothetical protein